MPRSKPPRKRKHVNGQKSGKRALPPLPDRRALEALMKDLALSLNADDASDGDSALDQAQMIMYDAWEARSPKERKRLARKALATSPLCADAFVLLAEYEEPGSDEALSLYRQGVEAGERALGEEAFKEDVGYFWGILETRPYMRARHGLATTLWARGDHDEAIGHYRDMLRLNPNDNQGIRYELASCLVLLDRANELDALLRAYKDDGTAAWRYTMALSAYRRDGDTKRSRALLADAVASNRHIPDFLTGRRRPPRTLPPYMSMGGEDEAVYFCLEFGKGWFDTVGAIDWLRRNRTQAVA